MTVSPSPHAPAMPRSETPAGFEPSARFVDAVSRPTPTGPLTVLAHQDQIVAAGFAEAEDLFARWQAGRARLGPPVEVALRQRPRHRLIDDTISAYFDRDFSAVADAPIGQPGTDFQQSVWRALQQIPAGETRTYSEIAATIAKPGAVRAVGSACGRNLIAPFVPCHRALRRDGTLGGYYYGLPVKRWLLHHEEAATQSLPK